LNNAFYEVIEKAKQVSSLQQAQDSALSPYEPTVSISTKKVISSSGTSDIEIKVTDNGNGVAHTIIDKIFQPFFTTKPTGSGTGLGLSLSYDIIKAHSGELKVETTEGEGSVFTIVMPVKSN
jgi:signal transduction histidine kinase